MAGAPRRVYQIADFEEGDKSDLTGDETSNSGGATSTIDSGTTPSPHGGTYQIRFDVPDTDGTSAGARARFGDAALGGDNQNNLPDEGYFGFWYYYPEVLQTTAHANYTHNLIQTKQSCFTDYPTNTPGLGTKSLLLNVLMIPGPDGTTMTPQFKSNINQATGLWQSSSVKIASSDYAVPIASWFHVEMFYQWRTDFTARVIVWFDGHKIFDFEGLKTEMSGNQDVGGGDHYDWDNWTTNLRRQFTGNLYIGNVSGAKSTYADDFTHQSYHAHPQPGTDQGGDAPMPLGAFASGSADSQTSCTITHRLQYGLNRRVIVHVGSENSSDVAVSSVTYGGVTCTKVTDGTTTADESYTDASNYNRAELWECLEANLPADGDNSVVVTFPSSQGDIQVAAVTYQDADQSANVHEVVVNGYNPTSNAINTDQITTTIGDCVLIDCLSDGTNNSNRAGDAQSNLWGARVTASGSAMFYSHRRESASGTFDMEWYENGSSVRHAHVVAAIGKA